MTAPFPRHGYTMADYRAHERSTGRKHEYFDGEIYAMTGGSPLHALLGARVSHQLALQLHGSSCRVYSSDLGVRCLATGLATYADVTVVCGDVELDPEDADTVINPALLVEVTSPTSEQRDRGEKLAHYMRIPSLHTVVLVSHRQRYVEVYERESDGAGNPSPSRLFQVNCEPRRGRLALNWIRGVDCELDLGELYDGTGL